jgi:hypothetical protein
MSQRCAQCNAVIHAAPPYDPRQPVCAACLKAAQPAARKGPKKGPK